MIDSHLGNLDFIPIKTFVFGSNFVLDNLSHRSLSHEWS